MSLWVSLEGVEDRNDAAPEAWLSSVTCRLHGGTQAVTSII